jgi:hypothetical protein
VWVKQYVQQVTIQSRQYVNHKSEGLYGTRSCSIIFRKERLHEISLKSTEQFSRVTDHQAGRGLGVASRDQFAENGCVSIASGDQFVDNGFVSVASRRQFEAIPVVYRLLRTNRTAN